MCTHKVLSKDSIDKLDALEPQRFGSFLPMCTQSKEWGPSLVFWGVGCGS
jgi:hypothetical protein